MKRFILALAGLVALAVAGRVAFAQAPALRITYLYDNTVAVQGPKADWGFACLMKSRRFRKGIPRQRWFDWRCPR